MNRQFCEIEAGRRACCFNLRPPNYIVFHINWAKHRAQAAARQPITFFPFEIIRTRATLLPFATCFRLPYFLLCQLSPLSSLRVRTTHDFGRPFHSCQLNVTHARTAGPFCHTLYSRFPPSLLVSSSSSGRAYYFKVRVRINASRARHVFALFLRLTVIIAINVTINRSSS